MKPRFVKTPLFKLPHKLKRKLIKYGFGKPDPCWWVYVVSCSDNTYYTGIAKDVHKRVHAHNTTGKGARYTRTRRPVVLLWSERQNNQGDALRRERQIKNMTRQQKEELVLSANL